MLNAPLQHVKNMYTKKHSYVQRWKFILNCVSPRENKDAVVLNTVTVA